MHLDSSEFNSLVAHVMDRLRPEIRSYLENVLVTVRQRPTREMLRDTDTPPDETLLGLYDGTPIGDVSVMEQPHQPDTIFIFQAPLEDLCETVAELENEVEITIVHEIAHHVGISEERLTELGYA